MIVAHLNKGAHIGHEINEKNSSLLKKALWIDLVCPTKDDEALVEDVLALNIPTREEMQEIELSSRLYKNNNALFMTAVMIAKADTSEPYLEPISFVLTQKQLITIRYFNPQAFRLFTLQLEQFNLEPKDALNLLIGLLEAAIDRLADILEFNGSNLDKVSQLIFGTKSSKKINYQDIMQDIGVNADLNTKSRESLMAFNRLASFFLQSLDSRLKDEERLKLNAASRDIQALNDYAHFISSKVTFLLDATLGLISIEQSNIIKIFSVAAVIFLPPTLIASIYGMNFKFMPELSFKWGYLMAILLMILSALIPYKYFKYKRWL